MRLDDEEVHKLLQAIALMATAKPDMVLRVDDPVGMAAEVVAEVKRLRAALESSTATTGSMKAASLIKRWAKDDSGYDEWAWPKLKDSLEENNRCGVREEIEQLKPFVLLKQENKRLSTLLAKCNKHIDAQKLREERLELKRENERLKESIGAWREYVEDAMNDVENIHYECKALLDKLESWLYPDGGTEDDTETT